jgi:DNA-binding response OmpR family regulator
VDVVKILIVDDQAQFRRALHVALGVRGYEIREADCGEDALKLMHNESPDVVLLDWLMSGMDGISLCRVIRKGWDVPIIMVTAKRDGRSEALAAGANDFIAKPFAVDDLLAHIQSALRT